ncbi:MAG: hypothetical protein JNM66_26430 [Bryobacterales bacterium]|nr:hypothetical protein [Bryobacterales bacterium]
MRFLLATLFALSLSAQVAVVRTTGQYDADGSVLYSTYVATSSQKLETVAVGATVPLGTRFIESLDIPAGVIFEGVRDNVAVWSIPEIAADRLIGPFTFRARPDGAAPVTAEPPAAVSYQLPAPGIIEFAGTETVLPILESKGFHIFDQRGTINEKGENGPVLIGKTGVYLFVPEGAVRTQTTVTVERQTIDNDRLPKTETPLWWCGLYRVSITPTEQSAKNFHFAFPTRRSITPGLPITVAANSDNSWAKEETRAFGFGFNNFGGGQCFSQFGFTSCSGGINSGFGGFNQFGFGVNVADRVRSTVTAAQLPAGPIKSIQDGTSNTIIAILIGLR